jgi:hypothetical protein
MMVMVLGVCKNYIEDEPNDLKHSKHVASKYISGVRFEDFIVNPAFQ